MTVTLTCWFWQKRHCSGRLRASATERVREHKKKSAGWLRKLCRRTGSRGCAVPPRPLSEQLPRQRSCQGSLIRLLDSRSPVRIQLESRLRVPNISHFALIPRGHSNESLI